MPALPPLKCPVKVFDEYPPGASGVAIDYDARHGVCSDTAFLTPADASGSVAGWLDLSGNRRHARQSTAANRPTYLPDANGVGPGVYFQTTPAFRNMTFTGPTFDDHSLYLVCSFDAYTASNKSLLGNSNATRHCGTVNNHGVTYNDGVSVTKFSEIHFRTPLLLEYHRDGTNLQTWVNGVASSGQAVSGSGVLFSCLGAAGNAGTAGNRGFIHHARLFDRCLGSGEAADERARMTAIWGVPSGGAGVSYVDTGDNTAFFRGFPMVNKLADGRLVSAHTYAPGLNGVGAARVRLSFSRDGGKTWPTKSIPHPTPASNNHIVGLGAHVDSQTGRFHIWPTEALSAGTVVQGLYTYSDDNGATFSTPATNPLTGYGWVHSYGRVHERGSDWLRVIYGQSVATPWHVLLMRSTNRGSSWAFRGYVLIEGSGNPACDNPGESALMDNGAGQLVAYTRANASGNAFIFKSVSTNDGLNWTDGQADMTRTNAVSPDSIKLSDGTHVLAYARRNTFGVLLRRSADGGLTLGEDYFVHDAVNQSNGDFGYPSLVQLAHDRLGVVYYDQQGHVLMKTVNPDNIPLP